MLVGSCESTPKAGVREALGSNPGRADRRPYRMLDVNRWNFGMVYNSTGFKTLTRVSHKQSRATRRTSSSSSNVDEHQHQPRVYAPSSTSNNSMNAFLRMVGAKKPLDTVSIIRMTGVIAQGSGGPGGGRNINLQKFSPVLDKAWAAKPKAVALLLNSPGGSPVQSSLIYKRLRQLRKKHDDIPLLCFVEDAAASGGYYIASAADEIIADESR